MARSLNHLDLEFPDGKDHSVLEHDVLSHETQAMGRDLRARLVREALVVEDVIGVVMRVENRLDREAVGGGDSLEDPSVEAGVDHRRDLPLRIGDEVPEVRHGPDQALLKEHRRRTLFAPAGCTLLPPGPGEAY